MHYARTTHPIFSVAFLAACSLALQACSDPADRVEGVFVLESISGQPLPYSYERPPSFNFAARRVVVMADTIELRPDGHGENRGLSRQRILPDGIEETFPSYMSFAHRFDGRTVVLDSLECRANSDDPYLLCVVGESRRDFSVVDGGLLELRTSGRWYWRRLGR